MWYIRHEIMKKTDINKKINTLNVKMWKGKEREKIFCW
jgi:hypothetical protein